MREAEIVDEIAQHLAERYDELRAAGATDDEAVGAAWRELDGNETLAREIRAIERPTPADLPPPGDFGRESWVWSLWQDVRYASRVLRRRPGFAVAVLLTIAVTTGPATAMLGIANWFFFRPLAEVVEPHRLATVNFGTPGERGSYTVSRVSYAHIADLVAASPSVAAMAGWQSGDVSIDADGIEPRPVAAEFVSGNFFELLGVPMIAGRRFLPEEDRAPGGATVTVLSERLARLLFPDTSAVEHIVRINGHPFTVIGVAPAAFPGAEIQDPADLWMPGLANRRVTHTPPERWAYAPDRGPFYRYIARLAPDATFESAAIELQTAALALSERSPDARKFQSVRPMLHAGAGIERARLDELTLIVGSLVGTGLVLALLGTANLANLFVFRSLQRRHESRIRQALGASRARLTRLLAVETVLISLAGGMLGVGFAMGIRSVLRTFAASGIGLVEIPLDWRLMAMAIGLSLLIGLLLAVPAARLTAGTEPGAGLGPTARTAGRVGRRWRLGLAAVQLVLSIALLIGALLFVSTVHNLRGVDAGFDPRGVTRAELGFRMRGYTPERAFQFLTELTDRLRRQRPGDSVAFADAIPLWGSGIERRVFLPGTDRTAPTSANTIEVSPDFHRAAGIRLLAGRMFTFDDLARTGAAPVVISETLARQLFNTTAAVGRMLVMEDAAARELHVVGVIKDVHWDELSEPAPPLLLRPMLDARFLSINNAVLVRSPDSYPDVLRRLRAVVASMDPGLSITAAEPLDVLVDRRLGRERLFASVLTALAVIGFLLAAIGIHGLVAQTVVERSREFGIRLAIGASRWSIVRGVLQSSLLILLIGAPIGLVVAYLASRLIASWLFGVTPGDVAIQAAAVVALLGVVLVASLTPALRAARTNPVDILRAG
jgi:predicted permease